MNSHEKNKKIDRLFESYKSLIEREKEVLATGGNEHHLRYIRTAQLKVQRELKSLGCNLPKTHTQPVTGKKQSDSKLPLLDVDPKARIFDFGLLGSRFSSPVVVC